jgi:hypothetical protein
VSDGDNGAELAALLSAPVDPRTVPVRFSNLKCMGASPEHYLQAIQGGFVATPSMQLGSAVDALVYATQPVVAYPGPVRRGKAYDAFLLEHDHAIVLTAKDLALAHGMARGIERNPKAVLVRDGQRQRTIEWKINGRACRGTPDVFTLRTVSDLKTTQCSDPDRFRWHARKYAYHAQLAWYRNGLVLSELASPEEAFIVAVESKRPHTTTVFRLTERALEIGNRTWRLWWERLMVCEDSEHFPGYREGIVDLDIDEYDGADGFELTMGGEALEVFD